MMAKGRAAEDAASMPLFLPLFLLFLVRLYPRWCCAQAADSTSDAMALLAFKNNLTVGSSRSRSKLASWNTSSVSTVCSTWAYVLCSSPSSSNQQRVSELRLPAKSLFGSIAPGTIGHLDQLRVLSLRSNNLSGRLPLDFANLSALRSLSVPQNNFSGSLPSNFSAWPLLTRLDVSFNTFSGPIPTSLNSLTHLRILNLQNNAFNGTISSLDVPSLKTFNVSNNNLNGSIPGALGARFPSSSFTGNVNLCGAPLEPCSSASSHRRGKKLSKAAIVGIACGAAGVVLLALLLLLLCILRSRKRNRGDTAENRFGERDTRGMSTGGAASEEVRRESLAATASESEETNKKLVFVDEKKLFDLEDLLRASAEVLGKGTLGTTYKAVLEDGMIVAVKRLRDVDESRQGEYQQRIKGIGRLKHDNLVPLRAYYLEKEENLLVYDFMQNGSLSALLHGSKEGEYTGLEWEARMRIAATSAKGLAFLHAQGMVHGNVKSANVLLRRNMEACLADYCLSHVFTFTPSAQQRTPLGYLAPEITDPFKITPKADVFSFGVLLLELLTGKPPLLPSPSPSSSSSPVDLPRWVQSVVREEWSAEVFDPSLAQSGLPFNEEEMVQLLQVAMPCVSPSPDQRPPMADVSRMIDNIRHTTSLP